jgi:hypothetical protein
MRVDGELIEVRSRDEGALLGYLPAPAMIHPTRPHKLRYRVRWPQTVERRRLRLWRSADYELALDVGTWVDQAGERWCVVCTPAEWDRLQLAVGFEGATIMEES